MRCFESRKKIQQTNERKSSLFVHFVGDACQYASQRPMEAFTFHNMCPSFQAGSIGLGF